MRNHYYLGQTITNLELGSSGDRVVALQSKLSDLGYHLANDGKFGPATESAVKDFQQKSGLSVDGIVGPATLAALQQAKGTYGSAAISVPSSIVVPSENVTPTTGGMGIYQYQGIMHRPGWFGYPLWTELLLGAVVVWGVYRIYQNR